MERQFIRERQRSGIDAAKARGVYKGSKAKLDPASIRNIQDEGLGVTAIGERFGVTIVGYVRFAAVRLPLCNGSKCRDGPRADIAGDSVCAASIRNDDDLSSVSANHATQEALLESVSTYQLRSQNRTSAFLRSNALRNANWVRSTVELTRKCARRKTRVLHRVHDSLALGIAPPRSIDETFDG